MNKLHSLFPAVCVFLISILFISCGKDSVTGGTGNPPVTNDSLILSLDSLSISGTGRIFSDSSLHSNISSSNIENIKIVFSTSTNCDSLDYPVVAFTVIDTLGVAYSYSNTSISQFNLTINLFPVLNGLPFKFYYGIGFISSEPRYLRILDLKIYRLS